MDVDKFEHVSYVAIVIVKWQRSRITEKKSIGLSLAVTMNVELLVIAIVMSPGTCACCLQQWFRKRNDLKHFATPENDVISYENMPWNTVKKLPVMITVFFSIVYLS